MKTKVLVTGANGQLGKTFEELYSNNEFEFVFTSKNILDITNYSLVDTYFRENKFKYCINCAAYTNVEKAEDDPEQAIKINAEVVKNLALKCKKYNTILLHISTDYVFDGKKQSPYTENDLVNPINEYGKSKLLGEKYIENILTDYFIIRTSWLYSKHEGNFLKTIVSKIHKNSQLKITTAQKGTPTSCIELSKFIYFLISSKQKKYGIYHFSAIGETTWYKFALQIASHFKNYDKSNISPVSSFNTKATRPQNSVLNNGKAQLIYKRIERWEKSVNHTVINLL